VTDEGSLAGKLSSSASSTFQSSCWGSAGLGCGGTRVPLIFGAGGCVFCRACRNITVLVRAADAVTYHVLVNRPDPKNKQR